MTRIVWALTLLLVVTFAVVPGAASAADGSTPEIAVATAALQEQGGGADAPGSGWSEAVVWSLVSVVAFTVILGFFYFMKREVGAFPKDPSWVAPITIMQSRDFPDEGDYGDQVPSEQAHAEH